MDERYGAPRYEKDDGRRKFRGERGLRLLKLECFPILRLLYTLNYSCLLASILWQILKLKLRLYYTVYYARDVYTLSIFWVIYISRIIRLIVSFFIIVLQRYGLLVYSSSFFKLFLSFEVSHFISFRSLRLQFIYWRENKNKSQIEKVNVKEPFYSKMS